VKDAASKKKKKGGAAKVWGLLMSCDSIVIMQLPSLYKGLYCDHVTANVIM